MALSVFTMTIPAGSAISDALDCRGTHLARIGVPTDWTPAPLTFQIAALPQYDAPPGDADYLNLFHVMQSPSGVWNSYEVSLTMSAGSLLLLPPGFGFSTSYLRLRSGTHTKPVAQAADRVFTLVFDSSH